MKRMLLIGLLSFCFFIPSLESRADPLHYLDANGVWVPVTVLKPIPTDAATRSTVETVVVAATIANGAAVTAELDIGDRAVVGIYMPAAWTAADIAWECSDVTGGTFVDVYDTSGSPVKIETAALRVIDLAVDGKAMASCRFLKLHSVAAGDPASVADVNQGAERLIRLIVAR